MAMISEKNSNMTQLSNELMEDVLLMSSPKSINEVMEDQDVLEEIDISFLQKGDVLSFAKKSKSEENESDEEEDDEEEEVEVEDDWGKSDDDDNWDPDFDEFDIPKSKGKKSDTPSTKKAKGDDDDDFKIDDDFKEFGLFGGKDDFDDDDY